MDTNGNSKELLIRDLCSRLPYGVICHYDCVIPVGNRSLDKANAKDKLKGIIPMPGGHIGFMVGIDRVDALEGDIKPYLRPMSSMTEEECKILGSISATLENKLIEVLPNVPYYIEVAVPDQIDWLNAHHFDFRNLIEKGLAIDCTGLNIY